MEQNKNKKMPRAVFIAVILLWTGLPLGTIRGISEMVPQETAVEMLFGWIIFISFFGIAVWLTIMVMLARNWARITEVVLLSIGVFFGVIGFVTRLTVRPGLSIIQAGEVIASGVALVLLVQGTSSKWFRKETKSETKSEVKPETTP